MSVLVQTAPYGVRSPTEKITKTRVWLLHCYSTVTQPLPGQPGDWSRTNGITATSFESAELHCTALHSTLEKLQAQVFKVLIVSD